MLPAAVAVVASLALACVVLLGLVLALLLRRIATLARENTDRKWDVVLLRAEVGALRRRLHAVAGTPDDPEADVDGPQGTDRRTASPPAWRRDRGRPRDGRPRRRRPA